jgi:hypothetical protein
VTRKPWTSIETHRLRTLSATMVPPEIARELGFSVYCIKQKARLHEIPLRSAKLGVTIMEQSAQDAAESLRREIAHGRREIEAQFGRVDFGRIKQLREARHAR